MSNLTIKLKDLHENFHHILIDRIISIVEYKNTYDKRKYSIVNIQVKETDINTFTQIKTELSKSTIISHISALRINDNI